MVLSRILSIKKFTGISFNPGRFNARRLGTEFDGALKAQPESAPFGLVSVFCTVVPGLFVGAAISQNIASFLEENDLFVPDDDDDDDDN